MVPERSSKNFVILECKKMNLREIEQLEKKSIYSLRVNHDLKESVIQNYINDLNRFIKSNTKKKKILIVVLEDKS